MRSLFSVTDKYIKTTLADGMKYRTKKWSNISTQVEGLKIIKVVTPSLTMIADLRKAAKNKTESEEFDGLTSDTPSLDYLYTAAISQLLPEITPEDLVALQDKLFSDLEYFDSEKEDWVTVSDWVEHFDDEKFDSQWADLLFWTFKEQLLSFFTKQAIFRSLSQEIQSLKNLISEMVAN